MNIGLLGEKIGMTQILTSKGENIPVTAILVGSNTVTQVKTLEKDGYNALQLAWQECRSKILNKPQLGHLKKNQISPHKCLREIRNMTGYTVGDKLKAKEIFQNGQKIRATGISKGQGTEGVIKRYNYTLGNMGHGGGYPHRQIGSMAGGRGTGQRILKGKKMPGRMGNEKVTVSNLLIVKIVEHENKEIILVQGAIPGTKNRSLVKLWK